MTTDPILAALAALEESLANDSSSPSQLLAQLADRFRDVEALLASRRKTRDTKDAEARLVAAREAVRTKGVGALEEVRAAATAFRKAHGLPPIAKPRRRFGLASTLEALPPPKTVCRRLEWEVGRPPMIIGPPGAAKTYAMQQAVLDLVLGRPLWGCSEFRPPGPCRVLHVDLDQGARKTLRRYQRLLRGLGLRARDEREAVSMLSSIAAKHGGDPTVVGSFEVDEGEGLALESLETDEKARWRAAWAQAARGFDAVFIDSLRRLAPFLDENDSKFSFVPDAMRILSEQLDVVFILLHHASNKRNGKGGAPAPIGTRGTSAIDGAAGTQLAIEKEKSARRVTQIRAGEAAELEAFYLEFQNDLPDADGVSGVRLCYRTAEQAQAEEREKKSTKLLLMSERALAFIRKTNLQRRYGPTRTQVVANVDGNDKALFAALDALVQEGHVVETKDARRVVRLWAADVSRPSEP